MSVKGWIFSIFGVIIGLFILFAILGSSPEMRANAKNKDDARKMECVNAVVEIGKVTSYVDKQAYEKVVAEKCEGLTIDGQPIH